MVGGSVGKRIVNRDTVAAAVFLAAATASSVFHHVRHTMSF